MSLRRSAYAPPLPKMPPGLIELMDGLARDVLKNNPENVFEFCAHHMQSLLNIRDGHNAPKPLLTLEQKIAKAQKIINQRAEKRRRLYDEKLQFISSEDFDKQHLSSCNVGDNSESLEVKEIENKSVEIKENEVLHSVEQKEIEKTNSIDCIDLEINDKEGTLQVCAVEETKEIEEVSNPDTLDVDSEAKEIRTSVKEEDEIENTSEINDTIDRLEKNSSEENHIVTSNELQSVVTNLDRQNEDKKEEANSVSEQQNTLGIQSDNMDSGEITINIEQDSGVESQNEGAESVGEINDIQTEIDDNTVKDENEEITSTANIIEIVTSPPTDTVSDVNTKADDDEKQKEEQIDAPVNNTLNQYDNEINLTTETKKDSIENTTEDLSEPEIKQDDKIFAVILSIKSPEPDLVETNETDCNVQSNGSNQKEEILESTPESSDNKTNNMGSSMDLETAAITIQKVFRSFLFKTKTASYDDSTSVDMNLLNEDKEKEESKGLNIKDRRLLGISRMDTVLQTVNEEKSLSLSTDDSSTLSSAATIIQAHVRGFLVRNKFNSNKTISSNSLIDSDAPSIPSLEADSDNRKSKTVLNIHIIPEGGHFVSRDESVLTSMDLSLDTSPPSSINLHPLGYDKSERRKLKREDAIQSVSPPSNNSGKLSDEIDSEKEVSTVDNSVPGNSPKTSQILGDKNADLFQMHYNLIHFWVMNM